MDTNRTFGYGFGAVYALVGLAGFAVTGGLAFAGTQGHNLILFGVNPLHNIVHILVGGLFIGGAAAGAMWSRRVNMLVGVVYMVVGAAGLFLVGTEFNILALNHADNALHFVTAIAAIGIAASVGRTRLSSSGTPQHT